jgi:hypothetical protein
MRCRKKWPGAGAPGPKEVLPLYFFFAVFFAGAFLATVFFTAFFAAGISASRYWRKLWQSSAAPIADDQTATANSVKP